MLHLEGDFDSLTRQGEGEEDYVGALMSFCVAVCLCVCVCVCVCSCEGVFSPVHSASEEALDHGP